MPIIKKNDITPERPVIIVLYGMPGAGKTSLATTAENPIVIDTDRGYDRAVQRVDTLVAQKWQDILRERDTLKDYSTIICDTAKACLDDFIAAYEIEKDSRLMDNALKRYGKMADEFKQWVNVLRSNGSDIIFICHDKETQEGDVIKHAPDCTGQSKDLLIRIADQVGYVGIRNKQRVVTFEPTDNYVGKNVAGLGTIEIPDASSEDFKTFMAEIIKSIKTSVQNKSEAQRKVNETLAALRESASKAQTDDDVADILARSKELPDAIKAPFFVELKETLAGRGFTYDAKAKKFAKNE